ncbi:response regulator [Halobaculum sp. WSA2]|uniref:Response regulator n=1 Tax=Halobaculum saliterrae TaxID=2073113 RepID=A0A6B0SRI9_9EURY|nr:response regulator [Halobaculum saliterrae]MXR41558.1 response regulator [Halobaculum saliterrae]
MSESTGSKDRPTVLIVDDEVETATLYAEHLRDRYTVETAHSGEEALEVITSMVDVVLLDRRMPGLSGDDVLQEIRERDLGCRIVMVTGIAPGLDILDLPFDDYLVKPLSGEEIRNAVSRMLVRNACDDRIRQIVAIASKMATLESKMTIAELEASDGYAALEAELSALRERTELGDPSDDVYTEFTTEKIGVLF